MRLAQRKCGVNKGDFGVKIFTRKGNLRPRSSSQTVAKEVTSLPVPAVVGTAMIGIADSVEPPLLVSR